MKYKLSEIMDIIGGGTPKTSRSEYWNGGIPWLSVKDFNNDQRYVYETEKSITEAGLKNSSTKLLKKDDTIISARGTVGEMAMIPFPMAFNQSCYGLRAKKKIVTPTFLYYLVKHNVEILRKNTHGSVFDTITRDTFDEIDVNVPSIDNQVKIAGLLSALDNKIQLNTEINRNLLQQAETLFKSWFVEYAPFGGACPLTWKKSDIYSVANIIYGAPFSSKLFNTERIGKPIIRIRDLKDQSFTTYTTEIHPKGHLIRPGDIVVGMDGEFRPYIWGNTEAWLNQRVCIFECKNDFDKAFILFSIKPLLNAIEQTQVGTTVIHIGKKDFDRFKIVLPDRDVLDKYGDITAPMLEQVVNNFIENKQLAQLRDTLLPKLMSGEIDVSNIAL